VKILFQDESGDHNLTVIDDNYPVFVLGGAIVDRDYAEGPLAGLLISSSMSYLEELTSCCILRTLTETRMALNH
jgi:hypothetical protein